MDLINEQAQWMQKRNYLLSYKKRRLEELGGLKEELAREQGFVIDPYPTTFCCISTPWPTVEECEIQIKRLDEELEKERQHLDVKTEKDLFFGNAFVVFEK